MAKNELNILLNSELDTLEFGAGLAEKMPSTDSGIIYLCGDLGAGKTTLVRGLLTGFGHEGPVKSPTYTLVESYQFQKEGFPYKQVHHFDLYRLEHPEELEFMGGREYFEQSLCLIEWPEKGLGWLPDPDLLVTLNVQGNARQISLEWQNSAA